MKKRISKYILCLVFLFSVSLSACKKKEDHQHEYGELRSGIAATCTKSGIKSHYFCKGCGTYFDESKNETTLENLFLDTLNHNFLSYEDDDNAICTHDGTETAICDREGCNVTDTRIKENSVLNHVFSCYTSNNDATCTHDGTETAICDREGCNVTDTRIEEGSKKEHDFGEWMVITNPTCKDDGMVERTCECGLKETKNTPPIEHNFSDEYTLDLEPSCLECGERSRHCTYAGCNERSDIENVSCLGHDFSNEYYIDVENSCTINGVKSKHCLRDGCNARTDEEIIPATGHIGGVATCSLKAICERCNNPYGEINPNNHALGELQEEVAATCTKSGIKSHYQCNGCNKYFNNDDAKTETTFKNLLTGLVEHNFVVYISNNDATCAKNGTETAICTREDCNATDTRIKEGSALGHVFSDFETTETASCMKEGIETAHCTRYGCTETKVRRTHSLSHVWSPYKYNNDATCIQNGTETSSCTREGCIETRVREKENSALGESAHVYEDAGRGIATCRICHNSGDIFLTSHSRQITGLTDIGNMLTKITVPGTYSLDTYSFSNCPNLREIIIKGSNSIAENTFLNCPRLESIVFEGNVIDMESYSIKECHSLKEIVFNEDAGMLSSYFVDDCFNFERIVFNGEVERLDMHILRDCFIFDDTLYDIGCMNFKVIEFNGTIDEWKNIDKDPDWNLYMPKDSVIQCKDGKINLSGDEIIE